jgi:hypothetical protein
MSAPKTPSPAPRADEDRANWVSLTGISDSTKPAAPRNFARIYLAKRYRLSMPVATPVARPKGEVRHER